jgi:hypothetical protein
VCGRIIEGGVLSPGDSISLGIEPGVAKLDHLAIVVRDWRAARDWYARHLGLQVEFEIPERRTAALQDDAGFTLFVAESDAAVPTPTLRSSRSRSPTSRRRTSSSRGRASASSARRRNDSGASARSCAIPTGTSVSLGRALDAREGR